MPSIRVGFSSDLNITGGNTGIGTATPTARLEVSGGIVAERVASGGISTFKEYQGFNQTLASLPHEITTEEGVFSSLTGEIKITGETTVSSGSTVEVGKTKTLTVTDRFAVPLGETNNRDNAPEAGTTRFNQDFGTLEFFDGANWKTVNSYSRGAAASRAVTGSGFINPGYTDVTDYVNITTKGNAISFGTLTGHNYNYGTCSSSIRGLFGGGGNQPSDSVTDVISYITIASEGDSIDFGNLTTAATGRAFCRGCSSSTRGLFAGGYQPVAQDVIDYVEIGTLGNALDFGNLTAARNMVMGCSSPTRAIFAGGGPGYTATIDTVQIAAAGSNAVDFGDLTQARGGGGGCSSQTRGIFIGGEMSDGSTVRVKTIDYITIASFGNAIDFGESTVDWGYMGAASNSTRGLGMGGIPMTNVIDYIQIATPGNAIDFGDLIIPRYGVQAVSDSHGGLGGF